MLVMPKLHFDSFSSSFFVSLLSRFVVVAIMALSIGALSLLPTRFGGVAGAAQAQVTTDVTVNSLDSGEACSSDAQCGPKERCINRTCQASEASIRAGKPTPANRQLEDLEQANQSEKESVFKLTDTINNATIASWTTLLTGCATGVCTSYDGQSDQTAGVLGGINSTIIAMFTSQPANTGTAIADAFNSAGIAIAPPAMAQGIGFAALDPILETWKVFRNLAYLFFILAFVVIGFMIMFRQKVGQAAITAQQAIPQIIIALIMVTFSYAIAGLLIDLMYLLMYLLIGIFGQNRSLIEMNTFELGWNLLTNSWSNIGAIGNVVDGLLSTALGPISDGLGLAVNAVFLLIISVAVVIGMMRLFLELLKTYITLVISIALAPVILMFGAIPGRNSFGEWVQSLIGNLAAFPAVLLVLIIFEMIVGAKGVNESGFLPPYLFGAGAGGVIPMLLGLGLVIALPEVVIKVKETLGAKDSFGWLTSAVSKRINTSSQIALPLAGAVGGTVYGLGANAGILTDSGRSRMRKMQDYPAEVGSAASSGLKMGQAGLKWYQRAMEGRLLQMEDVETLLAGIKDRSKGGDGGKKGDH